MDNNKLKQIIQDKNEQRERNVVRTAEELIENIVREQQTIINAQKRIDGFRIELKTLQVEQLDAEAVLGALSF